MFEDDYYEVVMQERAFFGALHDFIDAGKAEGFYNALRELDNVCPASEKPLLRRAMMEYAKELRDNGYSYD